MPLPLWREPGGEGFEIGHLAFSTADPLVVVIGRADAPAAELPWRAFEAAAKHTVSCGRTVIQPGADGLLVRFADETLWRMLYRAHHFFTSRVASLLPGEQGQQIYDWDGALTMLLSGEHGGGCTDGTGHGR
ncbi:hypothetical protein [Spongiactinospora gelatinilytica]|nr:hypothetical protein [Spongiactinospora gelatinilytica]